MTQVAEIQFTGGLNMADSLLQTQPGECHVLQNFECLTRGGYRFLEGYERLNCKVANICSDATYKKVNFTAGSLAGVYGDSLSVGWFAGDNDHNYQLVDSGYLTSGGFVTHDGVGYYPAYFSSNGFATFGSASITINAASAATPSGTAHVDAAISDPNYYAWKLGAENIKRGLATAVTGSGPVRCVFNDGNTIYALRDNVGGTALALLVGYTVPVGSPYDAWGDAPLGSEIYFNTGTTAINVGDTITGGTSGASAYVGRVIVSAGTWGGAPAASGRIVARVTSGAFINGENIQVGGITRAVSTSASTAITLLPGGTFEVVQFNFGGAAGTKRFYLCDGVNPALEITPNVYPGGLAGGVVSPCIVPIRTGMTVDKPTHVAPFGNYLFLSFAGGSVQNSSVGDPLVWSVRTGANEFGVGDEVTALVPTKGGALAIYCKNQVKVLYGTGPSDWQLKLHSDRVGAYAYTAQEVNGDVLALDNNGVYSLTASKNYGNWESTMVSRKVESILRQKTPKCSLASHKKGQYRLQFTDGSWLCMTFDGQQAVGASLLKYPDLMRCLWVGEDANGNEVMLAGGESSGFVYKLDSGYSHDGAAIEGVITTAFNYCGAVGQKKRFYRMTVYGDISQNITLQARYEYDVGTQQSHSNNINLNGSLSVWDVSNWDEFLWSSGASTGGMYGTLYIDGTAECISTTLAITSNNTAPFTLNAATIHHQPRGLTR